MSTKHVVALRPRGEGTMCTKHVVALQPRGEGIMCTKNVVALQPKGEGAMCTATKMVTEGPWPRQRQGHLNICTSLTLVCARQAPTTRGRVS